MVTLLNHRISEFEYAIPKSFVDSSYGNDICASILSDDLNLQIFIDAQLKIQREEPNLKRFCVINADEYGEGNALLETEDFNEVLLFIDRRKNGLV